ncbi:unnamed protein product [Rotaria sordida]|uniref:Uncharacterized protein n=1 Tax=Rotaria sordida TaxID=392033 RepID=A0A815K6K6_9BILA|nr:unnamed protein product [Rotaria sordida]
MSDVKLDRFCSYILPRTHHYIKKLILDTTSMERILLVGDYPNLTSLELFNFEQKIGFHYFTDDRPFRHIFKHQITDLILHNNDEYDDKTLMDIYTKNVYAHIMIFFQNLKDDLINLKCFSLTNYNYIYDYDDLVVPLLRRMTHLEKLTLYLRISKTGLFIGDASPFIDGIHLHNEILVHIPQLHTFKYYISTETCTDYSNLRISNRDIQQTFTNIIKYGQTACIMDYYGASGTICHVYSLPFTFTHLYKITTHFPFIVFDTVTHLSVYDIVPFKHEFFMRINQAFPLLKCFTVKNARMQYWNSNDNLSDPIIEFTHLISLEIIHAGMYYLEQFLVKTNTLLPRLTRLKVNYNDLKTVTINFTREETRHNCSKVKQLIVEDSIIFSKYVYQYFPSL